MRCVLLDSCNSSTDGEVARQLRGSSENRLSYSVAALAAAITQPLAATRGESAATNTHIHVRTTCTQTHTCTHTFTHAHTHVEHLFCKYTLFPPFPTPSVPDRGEAVSGTGVPERWRSIHKVIKRGKRDGKVEEGRERREEKRERREEGSEGRRKRG